MIVLIAYYWYGLLLAFGIGIATAWWAWGQKPSVKPVEFSPDDEPIDWESGDSLPLAHPAVVDDAAAPVLAEQATMTEAAHDHPIEAAPIPQVPAPAASAGDELGQAIAASTAPVADEPVEAAQDDAPERPDAQAATVGEGGDQSGDETGKAPDDLLVIKGIGPQLDALLRSLGVQRFEDIAGWMPEDIERIDGQLGIFKGRIIRDEWIGQARLLAKGDMETFHQRYGHLS